MRITCTLSFFLLGCATYTDQTARMRELVLRGETQEAISHLEESSLAGRKKDEVLFRMERGMLHYLSENYDKASKDWERSFYKSEELYTLSLSKTAASVTVSEDLTDYEGEDHERVLVPIFSALSFFSNSQLNSALVEIRRAYNLINKLKLDSEKNNPKIDGFPFLISGLLYEAQRNWDAAIIEYRKALSVYQNPKWNTSEDVIRLAAESLWRIAEFRGRKEIIDELQNAAFAPPKENLKKSLEMGEVILIVERGQSPIKIPQDYPINHGQGILNISFPVYQPITRTSPSSEIFCDGVLCGTTAKATDISVLSYKTLEQRRLRDFAKMTARLIIKESTRNAARNHFGEIGGLAVMIANAATERADTRSWTLLPENIQVARIPIPANRKVKIEVKTSNPVGATQWNVSLSAGKKQLLRIRSMY